jgi:hypothetical protein
MITIPTHAPDSFRRATTARWRISVPDYLPADGWVVTVLFSCLTDHQAVVATDNGDGTHLVTISTTASAAFIAGHYTYSASAAKAGEVFELLAGQIEVLPALSANVDARSQVKRNLDAVLAFKAAKIAGGDRSGYSIASGNGSRSLTSYPWAEILELEKNLRRQYAQELNRERVRQGRPSSYRRRVRFV